MKLIRVLLADDHLILLESLSSLLSKQEGVTIVAKAPNGAEALRMIEQTPVDVVITDFNMPHLDGIDFTIRLRERFPHIKVIMLTMIEEGPLIREAIRAGISGYVFKSASPDELRMALTEVAEGRKYFGTEVEKYLATIPNSHVPSGYETVEGIPQLTKREIEIIRCISRNLSGEAISAQLGISPHTLETHRRNIFKKLGVNSVIGLMRFAIKHKLMD